MLWLSNLSGGNEEIHEICSQGGPAEILYEDSPENKLGNFTTQTKLLGEAQWLGLKIRFQMVAGLIPSARSREKENGALLSLR